MDRQKEEQEDIIIEHTKRIMAQMQQHTPYNNMTKEELAEVEKEVYDEVKENFLKDSIGNYRTYAYQVNGIICSDLEIGYGEEEFETKIPIAKYVFFSKSNKVDVYVPIRVKILYEINKTKEAVEELAETKLFIKQKARELEKNLKGAIVYMRKIEELYTPKLDDEQDEFLNTLRVNDSYKEERKLAKNPMRAY